jgi:hypothetical protein
MEFVDAKDVWACFIDPYKPLTLDHWRKLEIAIFLLPSILWKETMARLSTIWCMLIPSLLNMLRR